MTSGNPYKPFICLEGLPCEEIGEAYEKGQENPDSKIFVNRKSLVEVIHNTWATKFKHAEEIGEDYSSVEQGIVKAILNLISRHGLKEEELP